MNGDSMAQAVSMKLNRGWRLLVTAVSFAIFGIGGLLLSLAWFNILLLVCRDPARRRCIARHSISFCFRGFLLMTRWLGVLDYRIEGGAVLQAERGILIVANHPTLLDYVLLASVMPQAGCLVKAALLRNPFVSGVIKAADYMPNSQGDTLLSNCAARLNAGETILIFPEGTRTRAGQGMILQRGAANIAVRCGCDMQIVHIQCSQPLLDKQSKWYQVPPCKPVYRIGLGERVAIDLFHEVRAQAPTLAARRVNRYLLDRLQPVPTPLAGMEDASTVS